MALIEYVDGKVRGEVATKEDLLLLKGDLEAKIQGVKDDLEIKIQGVKEEVWKLRLLIVVVLVVVIVLNPKVLELVGRVLGLVK